MLLLFKIINNFLIVINNNLSNLIYKNIIYHIYKNIHRKNEILRVLNLKIIIENETYYIKTMIIESIFCNKLYKLFIYKKQQCTKIIVIMILLILQ